MNKLRTLALTAAVTALAACSNDLGPATPEQAPPAPVEAQGELEEPGEDVVEPAGPDCAAILEEAAANQDASLENELEDCLAERLTPIASSSGDEEGADDADDADGAEDGQSALDELLSDLEDAGFDIPDLSACAPLLEAQDIAGFAECVSEAIWEDLDLPELEDACAEILDAEGPEAFAECVGEQLGAEGGEQLPSPEEGECLPLLEEDLDAFIECVADELEGFLCGEDDAPLDPVDDQEPPVDEEPPADEPSLDEACLAELEAAEQSNSDEDWLAYDECLADAVPGFGDCLAILDQAESLDDEAVWDAFDACLASLP